MANLRRPLPLEVSGEKVRGVNTNGEVGWGRVGKERGGDGLEDKWGRDWRPHVRCSVMG